MHRHFLMTNVLLFLSLCVYAQREVSFIEEYIDFSIDENYFSINGIFVFNNHSERKIRQTIRFPFAEKTAIIDSIKVTNISRSEQIAYMKSESSILFDFIIPAKDTTHIHIFYRQPTSPINHYIITTTQSWGKALEKAIYTLYTSPDISIDYFSYTPDSKEERNDGFLYRWTKEDFSPEEDFIFKLK